MTIQARKAGVAVLPRLLKVEYPKAFCKLLPQAVSGERAGIGGGVLYCFQVLLFFVASHVRIWFRVGGFVFSEKSRDSEVPRVAEHPVPSTLSARTFVRSNLEDLGDVVNISCSHARLQPPPCVDLSQTTTPAISCMIDLSGYHAPFAVFHHNRTFEHDG